MLSHLEVNLQKSKPVKLFFFFSNRILNTAHRKYHSTVSLPFYGSLVWNCGFLSISWSLETTRNLENVPLWAKSGSAILMYLHMYIYLNRYSTQVKNNKNSFIIRKLFFDKINKATNIAPEGFFFFFVFTNLVTWFCSEIFLFFFFFKNVFTSLWF